MPRYEYMTDDERIIEHVKAMAEADPIGARVEVPDPEHGGTVMATRVVSDHRLQGDNWKPYISERLPRNLEGVPCTREGKPIVTSRAQERDICAKFGYVRE